MPCGRFYVLLSYQAETCVAKDFRHRCRYLQWSCMLIKKKSYSSRFYYRNALFSVNYWWRSKLRDVLRFIMWWPRRFCEYWLPCLSISEVLPWAIQWDLVWKSSTCLSFPIYFSGRFAQSKSISFSGAWDSSSIFDYSRKRILLNCADEMWQTDWLPLRGSSHFMMPTWCEYFLLLLSLEQAAIHPMPLVAE